MENVTSTSQPNSLKTKTHNISNHDMLGYLLYLEHEKEHEKQRLASKCVKTDIKQPA